MVAYPGSFAGHLISCPDPNIDYVAFQSVSISVRQNNRILSTKLIEKIGQFFELPFNYNELTGNVQLIIETCHADNQFNKDNSVKLVQLIVDDLFTIPHLLMAGKLMHNNQLLDTGNMLWQSGQLIYTFNLPISSITNIKR